MDSHRDAPAGIRLALAQGQPLGSERFSEIVCAANGVRRGKESRAGRWQNAIKVCELKIKPILDFEQEEKNAKT